MSTPDLSVAGAAQARRDHLVHGVQRVQTQRQEVPSAQERRQPPLPLDLKDVDDAGDEEEEEEGAADDAEVDPAGVRQGEDDSGEDDEHEEEVEDGEPAVAGRLAPQQLGHGHRDAGEGDGEEKQRARQVEEHVAQRDLQGVAHVGPLGGQRRQDTRHRRADVGAQGERVHAFYADDAHADERREGGCEDGAALDDQRHAAAHGQRQVAREAGRSPRQVLVDRLADHLGHMPVQ